MMSKLRVGIEINEILRARWLQFDRYYVQEFGEEAVPENQEYVYDLFSTYKWEDVVEVNKELKEPEDIPKDINPLEYQVNDNGEADADIFLFKKPEELKLTAKQVYNRFMFEDYLLEIHGSAPPMYRGMDLEVNKFLDKYSDTVEFSVLSVENKFSIPPTLFFLSKITSRFKNIRFVDKAEDMWEYVDILITTNPKLLDNGVPDGKFEMSHENEVNTINISQRDKHIIKLDRPYNKKCQDGAIKGQLLQINDLNGNEMFEKLINYNPKDK